MNALKDGDFSLKCVFRGGEAGIDDLIDDCLLID